MRRPLRRARRADRSARGLTLIEVVVASGLLVASLVPILRALTQVYATQRRVETTSRATSLAQGVLDSLRARSEADYSQGLTMDSQDLGDGYRVSVVDDGDLSLRTVTVSVGYDDNADGRLDTNEIRISLNSRIARRG